MHTENAERPSSRIHAGLCFLLIFVAGIFIYCLQLGGSPLDRTEPFRALVADQMVKGGSWLIPRLYGEVYLRKPPLIYWIEASVQKLVGHGNELVWRIPSAIGSAFLAAFLAWWAGRWFGPRARLPTGFACLALVALWDQDRSADIDALNTLAAMLTTAAALELVCGIGRWRWAWSLGLGLSLGATLLLKGPGGLPQVLAALVGPAIVLRNWRIIRKPSIAIGFAIGFAIFAGYIIAAKIAMHRAGITPDRSGWYEVIEKTLLYSPKRRLLALLMPVELLVYALPVSAVLPFAWILIRGLPAASADRTRALAVVGTLAAALIVWMIDGNNNPRYEYVMLPLLAPLVGFAWANWQRRGGAFDQALLGVCVLLCGANLLISIKLKTPAGEHWILIADAAVSAVVLIGLIVGFGSPFSRAPEVSGGKRGAATGRDPALPSGSTPRGAAKQECQHYELHPAGMAAVLLLLLFAIPMAARKNAERQRKSAANGAVQLRAVIGNATRVSAAGLVRDLPELFYYAKVDVDSYSVTGLPELAAQRGRWVVLADTTDCPAYSTIINHIPGAFPKGSTRLKMPDPRDVIYVGWYEPPANANTHFEWHALNLAEPEE